jgi:hypothetical protein
MNQTLTIVLIVLIAVLVSLAGLALVRRIVPISKLAEHTEVAGYVYAVIGVIYAVVLALVVIAAWEDYRDARDAVTNEASAVLNLARVANGWPAADRDAVESALIDYARHVVDDEWPAMARGDFGPTADIVTVNRLWQALNEADASAATKSASYEIALQQLGNLGEARRNRMLLGEESLPVSMAAILIIGAVVTVGFAYLFAVENGRTHALMITSLTVLVVLLLLLQFQLEMPFQGVSAIEPTPMRLVLAELESASGIPGMNP